MAFESAIPALPASSSECPDCRGFLMSVGIVSVTIYTKREMGGYSYQDLDLEQELHHWPGQSSGHKVQRRHKAGRK
uniref:HDC06598 n=1 Tax=Drosophila melanogaster TaxID=7227 RepID=Q6IGD2_DROME|nr:TPA_inf: HDC06598 [Drosophila melanogaster]